MSQLSKLNKLEHTLKLFGKLPTFYISSNGQKVGICWQVKTIQTPIRLDVSTDTNFFAAFQANLLNKNEISAIINAKFAENHAIFYQNRSFIHYFD